MDPIRLFSENLALIDQVIGGVCRRARLYGADAEDFAGSAMLALVENDYAILRKYEGRAALSTYLTIVIERLLADARMHERGRWHPSAEATRMGAAGLLLETLVRRDKRSFDEALPLVLRADPSLTREAVERMLARLPERRVRPAVAELDALPSDRFVSRDETDAPLRAAEARALSDRATRAVREALAKMALEERMLIRFRYVAGMSIADIARATRMPQRPLYRRFEELLERLRHALEAEGIGGRDAGEILAAAAEEELDLGLGENSQDRQSKQKEEPATAQKRP